MLDEVEGPPDVSEDVALDGDDGEYLASSWEVSCGSPNPSDHRIWDDESRSQVTSWNTYPSRANVLILLHARRFTYWWPYDYIRTDLVASCTGVMLGPDFVLTNAHCLSLESGNDWVSERDPDLVVVCTRGNRAGSGSLCSTANDLAVNPAYLATSTNGDVDQDWGVVHLSTPIIAASEAMFMSTSTPTTWDDFNHRIWSHDAYELGFETTIDWGPPVTYDTHPSCQANQVSAATSSIPDPDPDPIGYGFEDLSLIGMALHSQVLPGTSASISSTLVRTVFDGAVGASGSPYFFCPTGNCNTGMEIFGLHAAYNPYVTHRHRGPRVNRFRTWVEANAP
ncbi:MAG: trypsin-like serine protease [Alphaproteobacteria bacterium]|nr:trypsin-like serine protease [Alphaproteobacteria bacterium]